MEADPSTGVGDADSSAMEVQAAIRKLSSLRFDCLVVIVVLPAMQVGCGVGNTVYPLLELCPPSTRLWACDFSRTAVELVSYDQHIAR